MSSADSAVITESQAVSSKCLSLVYNEIATAICHIDPHLLSATVLVASSTLYCLSVLVVHGIGTEHNTRACGAQHMSSFFGQLNDTTGPQGCMNFVI